MNPTILSPAMGKCYDERKTSIIFLYVFYFFDFNFEKM